MKFLNITLTTNSAAPPPPPHQKSSRKILLAGIIIAIIVVVVAASAIYLTLNTNNNTSPTSSPGPSSPSTSATPTQTQAVTGASSIKFSVSYTQANGTLLYGYTWSSKNIGTSNMMFRLEGTFSSEGSNVIYIVNGAQQKAWMYSGDQWIDLSDGFASQWSTWSSTWEGYLQDLTNWSGGDFTYTSPVSGDTVKIYNVQINPQLPDSMFAP